MRNADFSNVALEYDRQRTSRMQTDQRSGDQYIDDGCQLNIFCPEKSKSAAFTASATQACNRVKQCYNSFCTAEFQLKKNIMKAHKFASRVDGKAFCLYFA